MNDLCPSCQEPFELIPAYSDTLEISRNRTVRISGIMGLRCACGDSAALPRLSVLIRMIEALDENLKNVRATWNQESRLWTMSQE